MPNTITILEGLRSYELQIWRELLPRSICVFLEKGQKGFAGRDPEGDDECMTRVVKGAWFTFSKIWQ